MAYQPICCICGLPGPAGCPRCGVQLCSAHAREHAHQKAMSHAVVRRLDPSDRQVLRVEVGGRTHLVDRREGCQLVRATDRDYQTYPEMHIIRFPTLTVTPLRATPWIGVLDAPGRPPRHALPVFDPGLRVAGGSSGSGAVDQYLHVPHPVEAFVVPLAGDPEICAVREAELDQVTLSRPREWVGQAEWLQLNAVWQIFADD